MIGSKEMHGERPNQRKRCYQLVLEVQHIKLWDVESIQLHPGSDYKHCSIAPDGIYRENQRNGVISWCWKSNTSNCGLQNCLSSLVQDVESIQLHPGLDYTHCSIAPDGIYRVSIPRHLINHNHDIF
uniref:Uncharacterized protein n=1 Tax=Lactuca sativa TaxID=4236 RepID=A0A9R1US66_LACSA|nr:hypothetical protein LSAT_V11C800391540 [Lactuca sativa]